MTKQKQVTDSNLKKKSANAKGNSISLAPLDFEQALESLLQVKPEKKVDTSKKKSKPKTKK